MASKLTVKAKSVKATEKVWLFYEFSFSLKPVDKPTMHRHEINIHTVKVKSVKATEKAWLFYEFSFSLNPGDKPIDAQA